MLEGKLEHAEGEGENIGLWKGGKVGSEVEESNCEFGRRSQVDGGCLFLS